MAGSQIGNLIDGRFRIVDKLGEGGMSIVWLARDERLEKLWAIKEVKLNSNDGLYRANIAATRQEANIMKRLDHPALPRIVDVVDDGDSLLVVMDYVPGRDLLKRLKDEGPGFAFREKDVVDWGIQLCDALGYLHAQQPPIIYRDMKPGNVVLQEDGTVKIIDFGIAREYKEGQTLDTTPLGTRGYAPPEAFVAGHKTQTDPRSDIYTLGVTLFHLVTGHSPMEYVTQPNLPPIRSINPALSPALENTIIKATDWDPAKRQQSCDELRYELENPEDPDVIKWMKRTVSTFKGLVIAGAVCVILGIGFFVASNMVRSSSYDGLVASAATADTKEVEGQPSDAEKLYTEAIELVNSDISVYSHLLNDVYLADSEFSFTEADRWESLIEKNQRTIEGLKNYDKLCFDTGKAYFMHYKYGEESMTGPADSVRWFQKAESAYDVAPNEWHSSTDKDNPPMTQVERDSCQSYETIGAFKDTINARIEEGEENEAYKDYFDSLTSAVDFAIEEGSTQPVIVQLRLYDTVTSILCAPTYLSGFHRAGVSEASVLGLIDKIRSETEKMKSSDSLGSAERVLELSNKVDGNISNAKLVVSSEYHGAGARGEEMAGGTSGQ